ncbi:MAG: 4-hydroxythreonine-4-phosphate dehydrogenase PdxA [Bacteroidia bacterium]|nr:4-hydroxythreonine-4-phosphate dehydrogenase PdxA [Bacteroidia bacterium]
MNQNKLKIGITIGDINGIGPELILKAFQDSRLRAMCIPVIYGSSSILNYYKKLLGFDKFNFTVIPNTGAAKPNVVNVIDCLQGIDKVEAGLPSSMGGQGAYLALQRGIEDALNQQIDALVTLPVDKATVKMHKQDFTGHTEMLAQAFGVEDNIMMMVSERLKVALVTNHTPLKDVSKNITSQKIIFKAKQLMESLKTDFSIEKPVIAVLGLNPHAGENGNIGKEEKEVIIPAIETLLKEGHIVQGPFSPDGFFGSLSFRKFDAVLAMYHDQGLIPFKLLDGTEGVNFTAAMPFIRTSPDHGVAYNIAGRGTADVTSFRNAIYLAIDVHARRSENVALRSNALIIEKKQISKEEAESTAAFEI